MADDSITCTYDFLADGFGRGDYVVLGSGGTTRKRRVTSATPTVMLIRPLHRSRAIEWLHARVEDWLLWPLADLKARMRVRPR